MTTPARYAANDIRDQLRAALVARDEMIAGATEWADQGWFARLLALWYQVDMLATHEEAVERGDALVAREAMAAYERMMRETP